MNKNLILKSFFVVSISVFISINIDILKPFSCLDSSLIINAEAKTKIVPGKMLEITLADTETLPTDLKGNPGGYDIIKITTTGRKKLDWNDYTAISSTGIPNIDLSNSNASYIHSRSFANATHIKSFKFPQGVISIGEEAFRGCTGLTGDLTIPDTVVIIDSNAFRECTGLNGRLTIPNSVETIGDSAFYRCSSLTGDLIIPNSVTELGRSVFDDCTGFNGRLVLSENLTVINFGTFSNCSGLRGDLIIPDSVKAIGGLAFARMDNIGPKLVLSNSLVNIGQYAFNYNPSIEGVLEIPESVKTIAGGAFEGLTGLTGDIIIPNGVTEMGGYAFHGTDNVDNIVVRVSDSDVSTNYREKVIYGVRELDSTIIEVSSSFDVSKTWLANERIRIGKPSVIDAKLEGSNAQNVSTTEEALLSIPTPFNSNKITITKDGQPFELPFNESPNHQSDRFIRFGKYRFNQNGVYTVRVETILGTVSEFNFRVAFVDEEPPEIFLSVNTDGWARSKIIHIRAVDRKSGVKGIRLPDGNLISSDEGNYEVFANESFSFVAIDNNGNEKEGSINITKIDRVSPTLELEVSNKNGVSYLNTVTNDLESGFKKVIIENNDIFESNYSHKIRRNGLYTVTAYDNVDNMITKEINVDVNLLSLILNTSIKEPTNTDVDISVRVDGPIQDFDYILLPNGNRIYEINITYPVSSNGYYEFCVVNKNGKISIQGIRVSNIDKNKPSVEINKNPNTEWSNVDVDIDISAKDI